MSRAAPRRACALGLLAALLATGPAFGSAEAFLRAAESAPHVVLGTVSAAERLDRHGRLARLRVERVLAGDRRAGETLRIAWEELGSGAREELGSGARKELGSGGSARFAEGERLLLALEPLPGWSLWRERLPERDALAVAAEGRAALVAPGEPDLEGVAAFLALPPAEREGAAGASALARLVATADSALAEAALGRLAERPGLAQQLEEAAREPLAAALAPGSGRPAALRRALLALVAERRLEALRPEVAALAEPGAALEARALATLARLEGGIPEARLRELLERPEPEVRAVAMRSAGAILDADALAAHLRSDPAPEVRAAALDALLERAGATAVDLAAVALFDDARAVRARAVRGLGALGAPAVPALRGLVAERRAPATAAPIAALAAAGAEGRAALAAIAEGHEDPRTRRLARLALGEGEAPH